MMNTRPAATTTTTEQAITLAEELTAGLTGGEVSQLAYQTLILPGHDALGRALSRIAADRYAATRTL